MGFVHRTQHVCVVWQLNEENPCFRQRLALDDTSLFLLVIGADTLMQQQASTANEQVVKLGAWVWLPDLGIQVYYYTSLSTPAFAV
jgi:hypothetical protein